jgi:amino acid permease
MTYYSCSLYIQAKNFTGVKLSSLTEIGYLLIGRKSVYILNLIVFLGTFQAMLIYFMIISKIFASFAWDLLGHEGFLTTRTLYVLLIGLALSPLILKKEIRELKIASFLLFTAILLFIVVFTIQLIVNGTDQNIDADYG